MNNNDELIRFLENFDNIKNYACKEIFDSLVDGVSYVCDNNSERMDSLLADMNKTHQEIMFLYDMLNDKHKDIGRTIDLATDFKGLDDIAEETFETNTPVAEEPAYEATSAETQTADSNPVKETKYGTLQMNQTDISFMQDGGNNNERILELHKQGKSNVSIAKELGLGVGEVKLVIDLFEGMK